MELGKTWNNDLQKWVEYKNPNAKGGNSKSETDTSTYIPNQNKLRNLIDAEPVVKDGTYLFQEGEDDGTRMYYTDSRRDITERQILMNRAINKGKQAAKEISETVTEEMEMEEEKKYRNEKKKKFYRELNNEKESKKQD